MGRKATTKWTKRGAYVERVRAAEHPTAAERERAERLAEGCKGHRRFDRARSLAREVMQRGAR